MPATTQHAKPPYAQMAKGVPSATAAFWEKGTCPMAPGDARTKGGGQRRSGCECAARRSHARAQLEMQARDGADLA